MMNEKQPETLPPAYFDKVYEANADPWDFEKSEYEAAKYAATMAALPREHYQSAFEIGCSIGVLTEKLTGRCHSLLAIDVSDAALAKARERCANLPQVRFEKSRFPAEFPAQTFDLIVVSEVGYYLAPDEWIGAIDKIGDRLNDGGDVILVHWTPFVHDYPQTGDQVHDAFARQTNHNFQHLNHAREPQYRLDVWRKL